MSRQFRKPLFETLKVNVSAIEQEFDYLTHEEAEEVAELFEGYLVDPDAWDLIQNIALDVLARKEGI